MKFSNHMHTKVGIVLAIAFGMRAFSFAGNIVSDIPSSASENRTIQKETTPYNGSCDISQKLAFYDGSPVFLRIAQPKGPVNYVFDKAETYIRLYGDVFGGSLKFPYISNMVPSTTIDTQNTTILTVEAKDGIFDASNITTPQDEIAGQIISNNMERSLIINPNGSTINYYYRRTNDYSLHNGNLTAIINPNVTKKVACTDYYIARCGDGVIDNANSNGIKVGGNTIERHSQSIKPNEVCDDGALNGTPGHCKTDCSGFGQGEPEGATCTLTASSTTIEQGESITLNASYTSGTSATFTPTTTGIDNFTYPNWNGTATVSPITTTTYTLTVNGPEGTNPAVCSTTITVLEPTPKLECTINLSPNIVGIGQAFTLGWNVSNGNFYGTYIYANPSIAGPRPYRVNANQYNGVTSNMYINQTGTYTFTMMIHNNEESATCTGILNVVDDITPCTLTTSTPTINPGETAILNGLYSNAVLANITPFITGLNFTYPTWSNSNIQVTQTETTTYTMNVQGVLGGSGVSCSTTVHVRNTGLDLSKEVVTNIEYISGDLVTFKINFGNNSQMNMYNVEVSDYLPQSLEYVSSQIFGVNPPYNFATGTIPGAHQYVTYSGFSLAPGQQGYLLVVGRYKGNAYANYTINNAFAQADDTDPQYAAALFQTHTPISNITTVKTADKLSYFPGEAAHFTIAVTNNGPDALHQITITDNWPTSPCVTLNPSRSSNMPLTVTSSSNPYVRNFNGNLAVGQTLYLYLTGNISNDQSCVNTYINSANVNYVSNGEIQTGSSSTVSFQVSTTPSSTMMFEKRLVSYGTNPGDPIVFEIMYRNNGSATVSDYDIVDYRPGTLNFVSASPMPTTQTTVPGGMELHWIFGSSLAPNGSGKITINGTIK